MPHGNNVSARAWRMCVLQKEAGGAFLAGSGCMVYYHPASESLGKERQGPNLGSVFEKAATCLCASC